MSERLSLKVSNSLDELPRITAAVEELGDREEWPPDLAFKVNLVLDELVVNVCSHAYDGGGHEFEINVNSEPDALSIEVIDDGRPFDPLTEAPPPNLDSPLSERDVGGLGLHLVQTMMDDMKYQRKDGRNHLQVVARRDK